jgi:hypothetical protein
MIRRSTFGVALLLGLLHAAAAGAQELSARLDALETSGSLGEAERALRAALERERKGELVEALAEYDRVAALLRSRGAGSELLPELLEARDRLVRRIPTLTVGQLGNRAGLAIEIDGQRLASDRVGTPIQLNPGAHVVRVTEPGKPPLTSTVTLAESDRRTLGADAGDPRQEPASLRSAVLIGSAALAALGVGAGIGFTLYARNRQDQIGRANASIEELREGRPEPCASGDPALADACAQRGRLIDERDGAATVATVGFLVAGVGAGASLATLLLWKPAPAVAAGFSPKPGGAAATVAVRF